MSYLQFKSQLKAQFPAIDFEVFRNRGGGHKAVAHGVIVYQHHGRISVVYSGLGLG